MPVTEVKVKEMIHDFSETSNSNLSDDNIDLEAAIVERGGAPGSAGSDKRSPQKAPASNGRSDPDRSGIPGFDELGMPAEKSADGEQPPHESEAGSQFDPKTGIEDLLDGLPRHRGYTIEKLLEGLPEIARNEKSDAALTGAPVSPAFLREALAFIDPTLKDRRTEWIGILCAIKATPGPTIEEREEIAVAWSRGDFDPRREKDPEWTPETFVDAETVIKDFHSREVERASGENARFGSIWKLAHANGFSKPPPIGSEQSSREVFGGTVEKLEIEPEPEGKKAPIFDTWEFQSRPLPTWLIDGVVSQKAVTIIGGPSETWKTFLLIDALASIATGLPLLDHFEVRRTGDAVLFLGEDPDATMRARFPAWCKARGIASADGKPLMRPDGKEAPGRFTVAPWVPLAANQDASSALIKTIKEKGLHPVAIGIDTAAKAMRGLNQDSARDWGLLFSIASELRREFGCTVFIVHHSKKDDASDLRGSGAIYNDSDQVILMSGDKRTRRRAVVFDRVKDIARPEPFEIEGTVHETGARNEKGEPVSSLALTYAGKARASAEGGGRGPSDTAQNSLRARAIRVLYQMHQRGHDTDQMSVIHVADQLACREPGDRLHAMNAWRRKIQRAIGKTSKGEPGEITVLVRRDQMGDPMKPFVFRPWKEIEEIASRLGIWLFDENAPEGSEIDGDIPAE